VTEYVVTTSAIHPRDRFDYWFEATCRAYVPYECRPYNRNAFNGELRAQSFAGLSILTASCNGMTTWRTPDQVSKSAATVYLYLQLSGTVCITQDGREALLRSGDFALVDTATATSFVHSVDSKSLALELARKNCEARLGPVRQWTARPVNGAAGAGALASNFVRLLKEQRTFLSDATQNQVALQVIDLLALSLTDGAGRNAHHSSARLASILRLKAAVDANLTNGDATCEDIAAAAGISVRYANHLLEAEETSLQRLLFSRRISKCQAALADRGQAHRQISDIAYSWGCVDISHFGRLFKTMVGITPREFRKQKLTEPEGRDRALIPD
jgi:AraC-like DNA-binding protein